MNRKVLVTGATGAVGPLLVKRLLQEGFLVRTFSLDKMCDSSVWQGTVEEYIGDVTDSRAVQAAMKGVDLVVHMAALLHIVNPQNCMKEQYERVNVSGTANVMRAALQAGAQRVLLFSTIAVYGRSGGEILNESSKTEPDTMYAETKLAAEKIVLDSYDRLGRPIGVVLRLGAIYGPGMKGNYERLLRALDKSRFVHVGDGENRRTLISVWDAAEAAVLALTHPDAAGKVYNATDGCVYPIRDIIAAVCSALGRRPPWISLPYKPVEFTAACIDWITCRLGLRSANMKAVLKKYTEDIAVESKLIQEQLGFLPKYDLRSGWLETVEEMREMKRLSLTRSDGRS